MKGIWEAIKEEIQTLVVDGALNPEDVVQAARNPNSAMHKQFEWDDTEAAAAFRLQQARALIKRVKVNIVRTDSTVVHVPSFIRSGEGTGYVQTQVVVGTDNHLKSVVITLNQVATMLRNLGAPEVDGLVADVEALRDRLVAQQLASLAS